MSHCALECSSTSSPSAQQSNVALRSLLAAPHDGMSGSHGCVRVGTQRVTSMQSRLARVARVQSVGIAEAIAERLELGLGEGRLDEREELAFLESDVLGEPCAEVVQKTERRRICEPGGVAADQYVVDEHADDRGVLGLAMFGVGWEQQLFLEAEVKLLLGIPVVKKRSARLPGSAGVRTAQSLCDHERVMVIARERDEGGVAFHAGRCGSARAVTTRTKSRRRKVTA